jgi:hypothetical protein
MSDYRMNFGKIGGATDNQKLYDMLNILGQDDELVISIDSENYSQGDSVLRVLEENNFEVKAKGGHESGQYNIRAKRRG